MHPAALGKPEAQGKQGRGNNASHQRLFIMPKVMQSICFIK
jgi:hypothetical protein